MQDKNLTTMSSCCICLLYFGFSSDMLITPRVSIYKLLRLHSFHLPSRPKVRVTEDSNSFYSSCSNPPPPNVSIHSPKPAVTLESKTQQATQDEVTSKQKQSSHGNWIFPSSNKDFFKPSCRTRTEIMINQTTP